MLKSNYYEANNQNYKHIDNQKIVYLSTSKTTYTIFGYDFSEIKDELIPDTNWFDTENGEELTCNQSKGNIQFFRDPMSHNHLLFGYILNATKYLLSINI